MPLDPKYDHSHFGLSRSQRAGSNAVLHTYSEVTRVPSVPSWKDGGSITTGGHVEVYGGRVGGNTHEPVVRGVLCA
jgi:hypothetical protein